MYFASLSLSLLPLLGPWSQSFSSEPWRGHPGASSGHPASSHTLRTGPFTCCGQGWLPAPQLYSYFSTSSKSTRDSSPPMELNSNSLPIYPLSISILLSVDVSLFRHLMFQAHVVLTAQILLLERDGGGNRRLLLPGEHCTF